MAIFRTHRNWSALAGRIALAAVLIPHGLDKLIIYQDLGWMGPEHWFERVNTLTSLTPILTSEYRHIAAQAIAWTEAVGGGLLVIGFFVRLVVLPIIAVLAAQAFYIFAPNGFWYDHTHNGAAAPGLEYSIVLLIVAFGLFLSGAGSWSLDKLIDSEPDWSDYDYEYEDDDVEDEELTRMQPRL